MKIKIRHDEHGFSIYQVTSHGNEKHLGDVDCSHFSPDTYVDDIAEIYIKGFKAGSNKIVYAEVE